MRASRRRDSLLGRICVGFPATIHVPTDNIPECAGCARCCHLVVELIAGVDDDVPERFVVEHEGIRCMEQCGDGACIALDPVTRLCTIYERRPEMCRKLKRAESLCRMALVRYAPSLSPVPDSA